MKRKKHLTLLVTGVMMTQFAIGQAEFGVKAGMTFSDVSANGLNFNSNFLDPQMIVGPTAGLYSEVPLGTDFYFSPELNYTQKGFRIRESTEMTVFGLTIPVGAEAVVRMHYIDAPLTLKYAIGLGNVRGYIKAGPTLGYAVAGSVTTRLKSIVDIKVAEINLDPQGKRYNALEVGGIVGAGVEIPTAHGKFFVDASFAHGFSNIYDLPIVDLRVKNRALGVGIGYALTF